MLVAILKSIFPATRVEVTTDTGNHPVRTDIQIDEYDLVIEVKCTRSSMKERNLTEEVGADVTHYTARNLIFMIYDKESIISNPITFTNLYESRSTKEKQIHVSINQPVYL